MSQIFKKHLEDIPLEDSHGGKGKRRRLLSNTDPISSQIQAMNNVYLPAGANFDWHMHEGVDEFFIVLEGTGIIQFEGGIKIDYTKGDLFLIR